MKRIISIVCICSLIFMTATAYRPTIKENEKSYTYKSNDNYQTLQNTINELRSKTTIDKMKEIASLSESIDKNRQDIQFDAQDGYYPPFKELVTLEYLNKECGLYYDKPWPASFLKEHQMMWIKGNDIEKQMIGELVLDKAVEYCNDYEELKGLDLSGLLFNNVKESSDASIGTAVWNTPKSIREGFGITNSTDNKPADNVFGINTFHRAGAYGVAYQEVYLPQSDQGKAEFLNNMHKCKSSVMPQQSSTKVREKQGAAGYVYIDDLECYLTKWCCDEDTLFRYMRRFIKDFGDNTPELEGMWKETCERYKKKYGRIITRKLFYDELEIMYKGSNEDTEYTYNDFATDWINSRVYLCTYNKEALFWSLISSFTSGSKELAEKFKNDGVTAKTLGRHGLIALHNWFHLSYSGRSKQFFKSCNFKELEKMTLTSAVNSYFTKIQVCSSSPQDHFVLLSAGLMEKEYVDFLKAQYENAGITPSTIQLMSYPFDFSGAASKMHKINTFKESNIKIPDN